MHVCWILLCRCVQCCTRSIECFFTNHAHEIITLIVIPCGWLIDHGRNFQTKILGTLTALLGYRWPLVCIITGSACWAFAWFCLSGILTLKSYFTNTNEEQVRMMHNPHSLCLYYELYVPSLFSFHHNMWSSFLQACAFARLSQKLSHTKSRWINGQD
jgi:hypothetical protein